MKYQAILFDLDGTLLPMDLEAFTDGYFAELARKLSPYGIAYPVLKKAIWAATAEMVRNDGTRTNETVFWEHFEAMTGLGKDTINDDCLSFYGNEFHMAKAYTGSNPLAVRAVRLAREKAPHVVLATNPFFPMVGQESRMSWIGLSSADFDLVTAYETDFYCKPSPQYYLSVCERIGVDPHDCLMIGNDERDDMYAATQAGLSAYLVTDWCIRSEKHPWKGSYGTFQEMLSMLEAL